MRARSIGTIAFLGACVARDAAAAEVVATLRRPRVLLLEWTQPPMSAGHWLPELIELAGAEGVLTDPRRNSRRLDWAHIVREDPDVIAVAPCGFDGAHAQIAIEDLASEPMWSALRAVREGRIVPLDGNAYFSRPGPRLIDSAEILAGEFTRFSA